MKRYRVIGTRPVLGNPPGAEFDAAFPPEQEARLLGKSLAVVPPDEGLSGLSRAELDSLAEQVGIENPEGFRTKPDVIEAIQTASASVDEAEPASADTEHTNPPANVGTQED